MTQAATEKKTLAPGSPGRLVGAKVGTVIGAKRDKTRTVSVRYQIKHPKYGKYLRRDAKFHVHDPDNLSSQGDLVQIVSCRPISKAKSWRLVKILEKAQESDS